VGNGVYVAYYRVSTAKQGQSGLGLEAQRKAVMDFLNGDEWRLADSYTEIESGKRNDRPELAKALRAAKLRNATLVIAKLDRLSRDAHFLLGLDKAGVDFVAADMPDANRLTVGIMALVAQQEREAISARTKAALAAAKERGVKLGNPGNLKNRELGAERGRKVRTVRANERAANLREIIDDIRDSGQASLRQIASGLNGRRIPTARGGRWSAVQVKRVLDRYAA